MFQPNTWRLTWCSSTAATTGTAPFDLAIHMLAPLRTPCLGETVAPRSLERRLQLQLPPRPPPVNPRNQFLERHLLGLSKLRAKLYSRPRATAVPSCYSGERRVCHSCLPHMKAPQQCLRSLHVCCRCAPSRTPFVDERMLSHPSRTPLVSAALSSFRIAPFDPSGIAASSTPPLARAAAVARNRPHRVAVF